MKFDKHGKLKIEEMNFAKDRPQAENPVKIQDLTFRDGHQSIFATRGRTEDLVAVAEQMDEIGFYSMEVWGGATFDAMHRYLNEDPWQRIRTLKKYLKKTPISMLLRGQNLVGYRNYADDVVETFTQRAVDNGIDIFRVFDALNDFRNFKTAAKIIKRNNKHFQGAICYSLTQPRLGGDTYNLEYYLKKAKELENYGVDSVCIKDMAGLISPYDAYNLIKKLKENISVPIHLHTHFTSGMGDLSLLKAIEAGVDIIDTCMSPYAYRTSHPALAPLVVSLFGTNRDTGFDVNKIVEIDKELEKIVPKYKEFLDDSKLSIIDIDVILHQTPGGMLSNLVTQLKQMDELDKLPEVFEKLPKVRKDLGQVPLVTPTSQIVGTQTINNVLFDEEGEEYSKITEQVKDLCYGLYGKTIKPINEELRKKALKNYPRGSEPITTRPGDELEDELPKARKEAGDLAKNIDDVLIYALYPVTGKRFLKWKYGKAEVPDEVKPKTMEDVKKEQELIEKALHGKLTDKGLAPEKPANLQSFDVYVDNEYFKVEVADQQKAGQSRRTIRKKERAAEEKSGNLKAPIPGIVIEYKKRVGDKVKKGETIVVVEAMKMLNNLEAPVSGEVQNIDFNAGDSVQKGDILCYIEPEKE